MTQDTRAQRADADQQHELLRAFEGLEQLRRAGTRLPVELNLEALLPPLLRAALDLTGAPAGAVALVGTEGRYLKELVHEGLSPALVEEVERHLGDLGAFCSTLPSALAGGRPAADARPAGPAPSRPGLLAVPLTSASASACGYLLLAGLTEGLGREEQELLDWFSHAAALALGSAVRLSDAERRLEWLRAGNEISRLLLTSEVAELTVFTSITDTVCTLLDARAVLLVLQMTDEGEDSEFEFVAVTGPGQQHLLGQRYRNPDGVSVRAAQHGVPVTLDYASLGLEPPYPATTEFGPVMIVPLVTKAGARGLVIAARPPGDLPFSRFEEEVAESFAAQAGIALEFADARHQQATIAVLEEQEQVARDLQDSAIQNLFATGLGLQAALRHADGDSRERLVTATQAIDSSIAQLRQAIRTLGPAGPEVFAGTGLLARIRQLSAQFGLEPRVVFSGSLEWPGLALLLADVEAVLREALENVRAHASASSVEVEVRTTERELEVTVSDDGTGMADLTRRGPGLRDLQERAERVGGRLRLSPRAPHGLRLSWSVSLP